MPEEISPTIETARPIESKSTNWPKIILAAVLGLGLLAAATYAGYWYGTDKTWVKMREDIFPLKTQAPETPTPKPTPTAPPTPPVDETVSWSTHTHAEIKYQVKYPPSWSMSEGEGYVTRYSNADSSIVVSIYKNSDVNPLSLEEIKEQYYGSAPNEYKVVEDLTVDERPAFKVDFLTQPQREVVVAKELTQIPTNLYFLFVRYNEDKKSEALGIFDQILSTFKFLE